MPRDLLAFLRPELLRQAPETAGAASAEASTPPPETTPAQAEGAGDVSLLSNGGQAPAASAPSTEGQPAAEVPALDAASLTLPEGFDFPDELRGEFATVLGDEKLGPQERAQAILDLYAKQAGTFTEALTAKMADEAATAYAAMQESWRTELRALPQFAGAKLEPELGAIKQALVAQGADEKFFEALNVTGAGNHPAIVSMLHKLTLPLREGGAVSGTSAARSVNPALNLYPTMKG